MNGLKNWKKETISFCFLVGGTGPQFHKVPNVIRFPGATLHTVLLAFGMTPTRGYIQICGLVIGGGRCKRNCQMVQQLPLRDSIFSLLALTQHHEDLSAWPIYTTLIYILRSQTRPSLILIGFMLILEGYKRLQKSEFIKCKT